VTDHNADRVGRQYETTITCNAELKAKVQDKVMNLLVNMRQDENCKDIEAVTGIRMVNRKW
jgi:hypothetical protein